MGMVGCHKGGLAERSAPARSVAGLMSPDPHGGGVLTDRDRRILALYLPLGVAAAVLIDGAVFAALGGPFPSPFPDCAGCPAAQSPLGTALALGTPTEQSAGGEHWYNFTVESGGGGLVLDDIQIEVLTASGAVVPPNVDWNLSALLNGSAPLGYYSFSSPGWATGGETEITSGEILSLDSGTTDLRGQGVLLEVLGQDSFDGTITVQIP